MRVLGDLGTVHNVRQHGVPLRRRPLQLALAGSLGPGTLGIHLVLEQSLALLLRLGTVNLHSVALVMCRMGGCLDWGGRREGGNRKRKLSSRATEREGHVSTYVLDETTLVLEGVTLGEVVELVVKVLVDLAAGTVLD